MTDPPRRDDTTMVRLVRQGDERAFEELFQTHYEDLVGYAATFLRSVDAARDAVCETYAALWQARAHWSPTGAVRGYLFGAVRNRALNHLRDDAKHATLLRTRHDTLPVPAALDITVDDDLEREAQWLAIRRAIDAMQGLRGEAMRLRWIHQLPQAEIAQILGISLNAVQQHLSLALRILHREFGTPK